MIIERELKNHLFTFDSDTRRFSLYEKNSEGVYGHNIHIHYVQTLSFVRFVLSVIQKYFLSGIVRKDAQTRKKNKRMAKSQKKAH